MSKSIKNAFISILYKSTEIFVYKTCCLKVENVTHFEPLTDHHPSGGEERSDIFRGRLQADPEKVPGG